MDYIDEQLRRIINGYADGDLNEVEAVERIRLLFEPPDPAEMSAEAQAALALGLYHR